MNQKLIGASYTPIKIGMDYASLQKPSSMSTENFNNIKIIIYEATP